MSEYVGAEQLQKYPVHRLKLTAKAGAATPVPVVHLWIDRERRLLLKQQDATGAGKLLRTIYFPKWKTVQGEQGRRMSVPEEVIIYDEIEKGTRTLLANRAVDLAPLAPNIFTKAWLESRSR